MSWFFKFLVLPLLLSLSAQSAPPKGDSEGSIFVDAEQYMGRANKSVELVGKVKVIKGLEMLTCDRANVDMASQEVVAEGNVTFMSPTNYIKASKFKYNFKSKMGIITEGFLQTGQETIEGEEIVKNPDNSYLGRRASYTSCTNCPAGWKVSGTKINATKGSYAFINNPIIRIYGVPILWLPYIVIPIKDERQSGFLAPGIGIHENHGFGISESFFWAINRSSDMTFAATNYAQRGPKLGLEYRFVADKNSRGILQSYFLNDRKFGQDRIYTNPDPTYNVPARDGVQSVSRFGIHYHHRLELPNNFTNTAQINLVRDTQYINEFPDDLKGKGDSALENRATLSKNTENTHSSLDVSLYQDLLRADPMSDNRLAIHRVPSINYVALLPRLPGTQLMAEMKFNYLNLARSYRSYDGQNEFDRRYGEYTGSKFQTGDRYRTGQRLRFTPTVYYPIQAGNYLDLLPKLQFEENYYQFGYGDQAHAQRRYLRTSLQAKSHISGVFIPSEPDEPRYKHQFEPEITYTNVPFLEQDDHPFFGSSVQKFQPHFSSSQPITEYDNLQFDYSDVLIDQHLVTFALTNKLIRKRKSPDGSWNYKQILRHRLSESYDIANAEDQTPDIVKQPWSEIRSQFEVHLDFFNLFSDVNYYPYQRTTIHSNMLSFNDRWGNYISLGYSQNLAYQKDVITGLPLRQAPLTNRSESALLGFGFRNSLLDLDSMYDFDVIAKALKTIRFAGLLKPPGHCWGISVSYSRELIGGYSFQIDIPFFFGGNRSFKLSKLKSAGFM